mmetsp:Transcript_27417/g.42657  ORF Transcript_27417/g.42657 Transcript_27417/m.42657 type:complete len:570 (+) Transcript_27417:119-1828(+)
MDLSFAAPSEAADGDWGEDENTDPPGDSKLVGRCSRSRSRSPEPAHDDRRVSQQLALTNGLSSGSHGSNLVPPKSKIHSNPRTRYFVMKSNNHKNLALSVENDVWATQRHNEEKLNEALHGAPHVVLIFSVNTSGCFQGYAKMVGRVGASTKTDVFKGFGRAFDVRWLRLRDLEFADVAHIQNPLNDNQSVKISRDGQELPNEVGARLCEMADLGVFRGDPGGYVTDEREVETGGFDPLPTPTRSSVQTQAIFNSPHAYGASLAAHGIGDPPGSSYALQPPTHFSGPQHYGAATPSFPSNQPPPPGPPAGPWGSPPGPWAPHLGHGAWTYPPWGLGFEGSSYYSDSYTSSSSSDCEESVPQQVIPPPGAAPLVPSHPEAASVVATAALVETLPTFSDAGLAQDKDKGQHEAMTSGHSLASVKVVEAVKASKDKKSKKEKTKKEEKNSEKSSKRKTPCPETRQDVPTDGQGSDNRRDRDRRGRGDRKADTSKGQRSSRDRTRRRDSTSKAAGSAQNPATGTVQQNAHGYGHPPQNRPPSSSGVTRLPPLGHAPPPRAPPLDWHGACPTRR